MKRKLLAILTCICMLVAMMPTYAFADGDEPHYAECGFYTSDGELINDKDIRINTNEISELKLVMRTDNPETVVFEQMVGDDVPLDKIDSDIIISDEPRHVTVGEEYTEALEYTISFTAGFKGSECWDEGRLSRLKISVGEGDARWIEIFDHRHSEGINDENCATCLEGRLFWFWADDVETENGIINAHHGRSELYRELGNCDERGYFAYFNGTGYVPVKLDETSIGDGIIINELDDHAYSIDYVKLSDEDKIVKATVKVNGKDVEYSMNIRCVLPELGVFSSPEERSADTYLGKEILVSELTDNTAYIYAPVRMEDGERISVENISIERIFYNEEEDKDDTEPVEGIISKEFAETDGNYIWTADFSDFNGKDVEYDGRHSSFRIKIAYGDDVWDTWLRVYDHRHDNPENCIICADSSDQLFFVTGAVSVTDEGVIYGEGYDYFSLLNVEPGHDITGYFCYAEDGKLYAVNDLKYSDNHDGYSVTNEGYRYTISMDSSAMGLFTEVFSEKRHRHMFITCYYPDPVEEGNTDLFYYTGTDSDIRCTDPENEVYLNMSKSVADDFNTVYVLHPAGTELTGRAYHIRQEGENNGICGRENVVLDEELEGALSVESTDIVKNEEGREYAVSKVQLDKYYGHGSILAEFGYGESFDRMYFSMGMDIEINVIGDDSKTASEVIEYLRNDTDSRDHYILNGYDREAHEIEFNGNTAYHEYVNSDFCGLDWIVDTNPGEGIQGSLFGIDLELKPEYTLDSIELDTASDAAGTEFGTKSNMLKAYMKRYVLQPIKDGKTYDNVDDIDMLWNDYQIPAQGSSGGMWVNGELIVKAAIEPYQVISGEYCDGETAGFNNYGEIEHALVENGFEPGYIADYNDYLLVSKESERNNSTPQKIVINVKALDVAQDAVGAMGNANIKTAENISTTESIEALNTELENAYLPGYKAEKILEIEADGAIDGIATITIPAEDLNADTDEYTVMYIDDEYMVPMEMETKSNGDGIGFETGHCSKYALIRKGDVTADIEEYSITYNLDNGTNADTNPSAYTRDDEVIFAEPSKDEFTFDGWYADAKFTEPIEKIEKGSSGNITVYAKWTPVVYTVTYNANGGAVTLDPATAFTKGQAVTLNTPVRGGYDFDGWYTNMECEGTAVTTTESFTGNTTVYAKWTPVEYTITYAGGINEANPVKYTVESEDITLAAPGKAGYTFDGWYAGDAKVERIAKGSTGNVELTAKWTPIEYTITYAGGANDTNPVKYTVESEDITLAAPEKAGYTFDGWYDGGAKVETIAKGSTGNVTLEARWTVNTYSITYNANGGTLAEDAPAAYTAESKVTFPVPVKEDMVFGGWYLNSGLTGSAVTTTEGLTEDIALYAKWTEKSTPPTGGGGGTAVPPAEEEKTDVTVDKNTGAVDAELGSATTVKDGTAATVVGDDIAKKIVEAAVESKTDSVTVNAAAGGSVDNAEVTLSGSTVKDLADKTNADVTLKTDAGDVILKQDALDSIAGQVSKDESVTVKLEKTETDKSVAVSASISTSTGAELDTAVDVTVNMPDSMKDKEVVVIATDKDGYKKIVTGTVNGNACTFGAEPLSGYSVILAEDLDSEAVAMSKKVTKKMVVAKTEKGNVKLTVKYTKTAKNLKNLGYKVSYKYYYSTTGKTYNAIRTSSKSSTTWSKFKKGKKYYYKYKMIAKDASGEVVYTSPLKSCARGYITIK